MAAISGAGCLCLGLGCKWGARGSVLLPLALGSIWAAGRSKGCCQPGYPPAQPSLACWVGSDPVGQYQVQAWASTPHVCGCACARITDSAQSAANSSCWMLGPRLERWTDRWEGQEPGGGPDWGGLVTHSTFMDTYILNTHHTHVHRPCKWYTLRHTTRVHTYTCSNMLTH